MKKIIFASLEPNVGKTSLTIGISKNINQKITYMKPLGDRMRYSHTKLWDYDAELINSVLGLNLSPQSMTLGFDHEKLRYMYDEASLQEKFQDRFKELEKDHDLLIMEGTNYITHGSSIGMNPLRLAKITNSEIVLILKGNTNSIIDELSFIKNNITESKVKLKGVILNQIHNMDELTSKTINNYITNLGIKIFGIIPYNKNLKTLSVKQMVDDLSAIPLCAEEYINSYVKNIYIGSMSLNEILKNEYLKKKNKLLIVSGDRSDIILASIETKARGVVLTNNIIPPKNIISRAEENNVPLLLTKEDTHTVAKKIDKMEALLCNDNEEKFEILKNLVKEHIDIKSLFL